jgi:glycosyltransferase involved in cell wall biosynthesis
VPARLHPVVLGLGRADAARRPAGTGRILAALRDVAEVEWVGGGTATDAGIRTLQAHGIPVTGWLDQDEAKARLAGATAYLHWSAWDGQPLAVLEAMARDVAVVASDIPPNRELVGAAQVCAGEEEAIALLRAIVADAAVRDRLIDAQRERRAHYSAARMAGEWETVYRRLCGAAPVPEPQPGVPAAP